MLLLSYIYVQIIRVDNSHLCIFAADILVIKFDFYEKNPNFMLRGHRRCRFRICTG